jgi:hypothetical protein
MIDDFREVFAAFKGRAPGYFELVNLKRFQVGQTPGFMLTF